ncbi:hypothetical protein [Thermomonas alba]|uniref:hypothetical protein n=1 Tax=Thermomonas alba TaxID=2888525 RepID=UPI001F05029D|nr:hypothetical protein [Thermomonas alba]
MTVSILDLLVVIGVQELVGLNAGGHRRIDPAGFGALCRNPGRNGPHHLQGVVPILLEFLEAFLRRSLRVDKHQPLVLRQQAILVELLLKSVFTLRQLRPPVRQAQLLLVDLLGQRTGTVIDFLKKAQQLALHARLDEFVLRQEGASLDVRNPGSVRQIGRPDVGARVHPPDDLRVQDVRHKLAVVVGARLIQEPLQDGRVHGYGVVVAAEELQRLQVPCAGLEQQHVVAAGVGDGCTNAGARLDDFAEQVLEQLLVEGAGDETHGRCRLPDGPSAHRTQVNRPCGGRSQ